MGVTYSPKIATDGLVFYYDVFNTQKSWKGAPTTNLYGDFGTSSSLRPSTTHFTNGNGWVTDGYASINTPTPGFYLGKVWKHVSGALNSTWDGNSYGYVFKDLPSANGQVYTMSAWTYVSEDCNIDALPVSVETTTGYACANLPSTYDMAKKGTWQRIGISTTGTGGTTRWLTYPRKMGVTNGAFTGYYIISAVMVETGGFAKPYAEVSRSDTQSLIDLTGKSVITPSNLQYNSDGSFEYNGNNSGLTIPFNAAHFNFDVEQTLIFWMKNTAAVAARRNPYNQAYGGGGTITHENNTNFNYFYGTAGGNTSPYVALTSSFSVINGETAMIAVTRDPATVSWYKNGLLTNSAANAYGQIVTGVSNINIGIGYAGPYAGNLYAALIYNRCLTADEIRQNFGAFRGRHGL